MLNVLRNGSAQDDIPRSLGSLGELGVLGSPGMEFYGVNYDMTPAIPTDDGLNFQFKTIPEKDYEL